MMPLARAGQKAGHDVAFLTSEEMSNRVEPFTAFVAGPSLADLMQLHASRTGVWNEVPSPTEAATFFVGTRIALTGDSAVAATADFAPDLVVGDVLDAVAPYVAAHEGVPWAQHAFGPQSIAAYGVAPSLPLDQAIREGINRELHGRGVKASPRVAYLNPCPPRLQLPKWQRPADEISVRPEPYGAMTEDDPPTAETENDRRRPVVIATMGTVVKDVDASRAVVASVIDQGFEVKVTGPVEWFDDYDVELVEAVGFEPLARLLRGSDAVVSTAGAGTVLGALSFGLPMVLMPVLADQPWNARRVEAAGAGITVGAPSDTGPAVSRVWSERAFRESAARVAAQIRAMDPADTALNRLVKTASARTS